MVSMTEPYGECGSLRVTSDGAAPAADPSEIFVSAGSLICLTAAAWVLHSVSTVAALFAIAVMRPSESSGAIASLVLNGLVLTTLASAIVAGFLCAASGIVVALSLRDIGGRVVDYRFAGVDPGRMTSVSISIGIGGGTYSAL